jgi:hypothetical protein
MRTPSLLCMQGGRVARLPGGDKCGNGAAPSPWLCLVSPGWGTVGSLQPQSCLWPWELSQAFLDWDRASDSSPPIPPTLDACLIETIYLHVFPALYKETCKWVRPTDFQHRGKEGCEGTKGSKSTWRSVSFPSEGLCREGWEGEPDQGAAQQDSYAKCFSSPHSETQK